MSGRTGRQRKKKRRKTSESNGDAPLAREPARPSRWWARAIAATVASLAALGIGELIVRSASLAPGIKPIETRGDDTVYKRSSNPLLGFELKANYRNPDANHIKSYLSTNSHGQRDIERSLVKEPGTRRVLILGDSVVEGLGIPAIADTISGQLERAYREGESGRKTEVLNFGVSGYCTLAEVELLEVKGLRFSPDVVVLVFVENDFDNFNREAYRLGVATDRPALVNSLFVHSHLARLSFLKLNLFQFGAENDPVKWNASAIGNNNVIEGLGRLRRLATQFGFEPLIAIWPRFMNSSIVEVHPMPDDSEDLIVERIAEGLGLPTVRLSGYFERDRSSRGHTVNPRKLYTNRDGLHPSVEGCRVAALALRQALGDLSALGRGNPVLPWSGGKIDMAAIKAAKMRGSAKPDYALVHTDTGLTLYEQGQLEDAIAQYHLAIEINPDYDLAQYNLANALLDQGDVEAAIAHYRRALKLNLRFAKAHSGLAIALRRQGAGEEAANHDRRAVQLDPSIAEAQYNYGNALREQGKLDEAIGRYRQAIRLRPDYAEAHNNLGLALHSQGMLDEAARSYRQAIRIEPGHVEAHNNLGSVLASQGKLEQALEQFQRALELRSNEGQPGGSAEVRFNLANVLLRLNRVDAAVQAYRQTITDRPEYAKGYYGLAVALHMQGHTDQAIEHLEHALRLAPDLAEARRALEGLRGLAD